jgi:YidC/Oxa1 family membrane protein insertase
LERRTIITIVLIVSSGFLFLMAYNSGKKDDAENKSEAAEQTALAEIPAMAPPALDEKTWMIPGAAEVGGFDVHVSSFGGSLKQISLHHKQFDQGDRSEGAPDYVPRERLAPGPYDMVGTWDPRYYPFALSINSLGWEGREKATITRLVRSDTTITAAGDDGFSLGEAQADDLAVRTGDRVVGDGIDGALTVEGLGSGGVIRVSGTVPSPLPKLVRVERVATPLSQYAAAPGYVKVDGAENELVLVWPNPSRDESDVWIQRTWSVDARYRVEHRTQVLNLASDSLEVHYRVNANGWVDPWGEEPGMFSAPLARWSPACYVEGDLESEGLQDILEEDGQRETFAGQVNWFGVNSQYFLLAGVFPQENGVSGDCTISAKGNGVISASFGRAAKELLPGAASTCLPDWFPHGRRSPDVRCSEAMAKLKVDLRHLDESSLDLALDDFEGPRAEAIGYRKMLLAYGGARESGSLAFTVYAGPKELETIEDTSETLESTLDFWFVGFLAKPLLGLLKTLHSWFGIWWLSIMVLTIMIKLLMLPLTQKSYEQMQRMTQLKPEMEKLQKKYANDKTRQQTELMALYKRHNMNPLGGCLPMVFQMPVYIALYRCIYAAVDLYQAPLFGWISDMTQPDPYFILPVLLGLFMLIQQMFMPTSAGADPMQQKIMKYGMPAMFAAFMLMLPAGLVFYIFISTVIGIGQQYYIKRKFAGSAKRVGA